MPDSRACNAYLAKFEVNIGHGSASDLMQAELAKYGPQAGDVPQSAYAHSRMLGWEIWRNSAGILWSSEFWTILWQEFLLEFNFSDRKNCSCHFHSIRNSFPPFNIPISYLGKRTSTRKQGIL